MRSRLVLFLLATVFFCVAQAAAAAERRIALVIGESAYEGKPIETAANDAGLIAQTLQAAGFDVSGARDLDETALRGSLRDFLEKARAVGPDGVAFVYFAGAAAQLEGDNYLLPVGAPIARDADIPLHGARVSDYLKPLASMGLKTAVIVLDAARALPYPIEGQPLAGGLALYEPGPSLLLAFNAAPGTIAPPEPGPYGVYAQALTEMIRAGGLPVAQVFEQTRLRVLDVSRGAQIPWNSQGFDTPFLFFERSSQAPPRGVDDAALRNKPIAQFSAQDAFAAAVARDTLQSYQDFLTAYPSDPLAQRARAILAARREALFWRKARMLNTPASYWTYLSRYPRGAHAFDARRLLAILASPPEPPPAFAPIDLGYPPPPPPELVFVSRPAIFFGDPVWGFAPPAPPPVFFLPPPPPDWVVLPPPVVVVVDSAFVLPVPPFVPVPVYVQPPAFVTPPPGNVFFANLHNSVVVDANQNVVIANPQGRVLSTAPIVAGAVAGAAGAAIGASLPRFIANKAAVAPTGANAPGGPAQPGPNFGRPGQGGPTQGNGLPLQGPGSAVQPPVQGSHALPQPGASLLQEKGAPTAAPAAQTQGQGQGQHPQAGAGHGPSPTQGPASGPQPPLAQQPLQGNHALPQPGAGAAQEKGAPTAAPSLQTEGQGHHPQAGRGQGPSPTQGPASGPQPPLAQQPLQGNHTLPAPSGSAPQGQNATAPSAPPQAPERGRQTERGHGKGHPAQGQPPQTQSGGSQGFQTHGQGPGPQPHGRGAQTPGQNPLQTLQRQPQGHEPQRRQPPPQMMQRPPNSGPQPMMHKSQGPGPQPMMQKPQGGPGPQQKQQTPPQARGLQPKHGASPHGHH